MTTSDDEDLDDDLAAYVSVGVVKLVPGDDASPARELANLEKQGRIRTRSFTSRDSPEWRYSRLYVLPDDVGRGRMDRAQRNALKIVMTHVDSSPEAWDGMSADAHLDQAEDESLWYIFNTLRDPSPCVENMIDAYGRKSMEDLLYPDEDSDGARISGLKTPLYPYQRRSAATMVQREVQPAQVLDPRLQVRRSPNGQEYYYDKEEGILLREKRLYSETCGGILSETMGCGKTLISLALILATRGHFPKIPTQYYHDTETPVRATTASLVDMAAAVAGRLSLPWKGRFDHLSRQGLFNNRCVKACENNRGNYTIPTASTKYASRQGAAYLRPPPQRVFLSSGTLIVTPPNLVDHWEHEIARHTEGLNVLVLRDSSDITPSPNALLQYDLVLFSRVRFEKEAGEVNNNRRISSVQEDSPLMKLHWLRIIVDEGHNVAGTGHRTVMVHLLEQLHVERRWIVSGTPSSGLYGVEVSLASRETHASGDDLSDATQAVLRDRKKTSLADSESKDIDKLRLIATKFLDLKPWSNRTDDIANWRSYMEPVENGQRCKSSSSLRATLQSLVVRHRLDVIHSEIPLPTLHNKVVSLEPTFYDKINLNLFIFIMAVNAVTSERSDQDYMFHPRNRKHLSLTISNLRQAGLWWAGSEGDIAETIRIATEYTEKNRERMSPADIAIITEGIAIARKALDCGSWNAFKKFQELGVFVEQFPEHARSFWALEPGAQTGPLLLGISQARQAQNSVASRLAAYDPAERLAGDGIKARRSLKERTGDEKRAAEASVRKTTPKSPHKKSPKKTFSKGLFKALPAESPLRATQFVATTSAKLTYLLDQVQELHREEKIIIFYDNNNSAFWIGEGLELLGIDFRIYATSLKSAQKTDYLTLFRETALPVLLMDLRHAAHGLHLANASRVFIINPIWQPNVESQAIKRAHRIGQTRPVFVETLVLSDTLEEKILSRRKEMSDTEMQTAEKDLLDDNTMRSIIENQGFIPVPEDEQTAQVAFLSNPAGFFDRHTLPIPDPVLPQAHPKMDTPPSPTPVAPPKKRKRVAIALDDDSSGHNHASTAKRPSIAPTPSNDGMSTPIRSGSLFGSDTGRDIAPSSAESGRSSIFGPARELSPFRLLS